MAKTFKALLDEAYSTASEAWRTEGSTAMNRVVRRNGACVREVARRTTNFYTACEAFKASVQWSFGADVTLRRAVTLITRPSQIAYLKKADAGNDIEEILGLSNFDASGTFRFNALDLKEHKFFTRGLKRATTVREYFRALYDPHVGDHRMYNDPPTEEQITEALALVQSADDVAYIYKYHIHQDDEFMQALVLDIWSILVRTPKERRRLARAIRQAERGEKGAWPIGWHASELTRKDDEPSIRGIVIERGEPVTD